MALDLSALLGGGDGAPDLGDALTSRTSRGDLVFSKPFGDATKWRTGNGYVTVTVIFDPFLPWSQDNLLCSTTPNYISNIRRRLGEHLVPDEMTTEADTVEQLKWAAIIAAVPNKTLQDFLQEPDPKTGEKRLAGYLKLLEKNVDDQHTEDTAMHKAITTREFNFTYHLAVDMYPQDKDPKSSSSQQSATRRERRGVLVFNIRGEPSVPVASERAKVGVDVVENGDEPSPVAKKKGKKQPPSAATTDEEEDSKPPMRKHRNAVSKKQQKELEQLLDRLEIDEERLKESHCEWVKRFPKSADLFFEQVGSWFEALLQRKQAQLERDGETPATGLYT